ncbi:MAG: SPOR domain-containing protein [Alphaproteobacteria bacterium]|nr:SPOR domain-containing protein [Alphaproteobacteria bacterium]
MLYGLDNNQNDSTKGFQQRVADKNIQRSIENRQEEIQHAKNGFIGMLAGILVGGVVGWLFLGPTHSTDKEKEIPIVRRSITPAKVQPNDPGGMEIDNQNREIYHIVDNLPQEKAEVNIIPAPEMPKLIIENSIPTPENIENLVESIEEDGSLDNTITKINSQSDEIKLANRELSAIKTNSKEKIVIPNKLKDIEIQLQKSINSEAPKAETNPVKAEPVVEEVPATPPTKAAKGTWYTQIIASSSRSAVENLWKQLSAKHGFLNSYSHEIEEITAANGSTLYRLKVGAFKVRKEAEELSEKLKKNQISSIIKQN